MKYEPSLTETGLLVILGFALGLLGSVFALAIISPESYARAVNILT
jgi:hypothetical protein